MCDDAMIIQEYIVCLDFVFLNAESVVFCTYKAVDKGAARATGLRLHKQQRAGTADRKIVAITVLVSCYRFDWNDLR